MAELSTHGLLGADHVIEANGLALHFDAVQDAEAARLETAAALAGESPVWTGQVTGVDALCHVFRRACEVINCAAYDRVGC